MCLVIPYNRKFSTCWAIPYNRKFSMCWAIPYNRQVGRLAPDSLCTVPARSMQQQKNTPCTVPARSLHNEHLMHTPCTVSPWTLPARSMHGPFTVTYEHRLVATFVITAPQLRITKPATNRHLKSGHKPASDHKAATNQLLGGH